MKKILLSSLFAISLLGNDIEYSDDYSAFYADGIGFNKLLHDEDQSFDGGGFLRISDIVDELENIYSCLSKYTNINDVIIEYCEVLHKIVKDDEGEIDLLQSDVVTVIACGCSVKNEINLLKKYQSYLQDDELIKTQVFIAKVEKQINLLEINKLKALACFLGRLLSSVEKVSPSSLGSHYKEFESIKTFIINSQDISNKAKQCFLDRLIN